jgi:hypothetical protein
MFVEKRLPAIFSKKNRLRVFFFSSPLDQIISNKHFVFRREKRKETCILSFKYKYIAALVVLPVLWIIFHLPSNTTFMAGIHTKARKSPYSGTQDIQVGFN